jgi:multimeric flavodoxin WrbA
MKALLLDGSRKNEPNLNSIRSTFESELKSKGWEVEALDLKDMNISPCTGCFKCWIKTPGICITDDVAREVTKKIVQSGLLVLLSPVTFGGYSSELKKALDRSLGIMLPYFTKIQGKTHHKKRYEEYPKLIALGTLPSSDPEEEKIFKELVSRNSVNAHSPSFASAVMVKGKGDEKIRNTIKSLLSNVGVKA